MTGEEIVNYLREIRNAVEVARADGIEVDYPDYVDFDFGEVQFSLPWKGSKWQDFRDLYKKATTMSYSYDPLDVSEN